MNDSLIARSVERSCAAFLLWSVLTFVSRSIVGMPSRSHCCTEWHFLGASGAHLCQLLVVTLCGVWVSLPLLHHSCTLAAIVPVSPTTTASQYWFSVEVLWDQGEHYRSPSFGVNLYPHNLPLFLREDIGVLIYVYAILRKVSAFIFSNFIFMVSLVWMRVKEGRMLRSSINYSVKLSKIPIFVQVLCFICWILLFCVISWTLMDTYSVFGYKVFNCIMVKYVDAIL